MLKFNEFRVLTFDCYGTLIDWEAGILSALRPVLVAHQIKIGQDAALELFGALESEAERGAYQTYRDILETVLTGMGEQLGFAPTETEIRGFGQSVQDWSPFPDSVDALRALKAKYRLVVISNIDDDLFAYSAKKLQVQFADVITAQQCQSYKPALNNFRIALKRIGVPQADVLHVAQSLYHDIAPAKQLGLHTVWVNRRHDHPGFGATPPAHAKPDLEVPDLAGLVKIIGRRTEDGRFPNS